MKNLKLLFATAVTLFIAHKGQTIAKAGNKTNKQITVDTPTDYRLNTEASQADWDRTLDQKATKQQVKLFGSMVDVDLGPIQLNTKGSVETRTGRLTTTNGAVTESTVVFDMSSFKFAQEKGSGLFDVTNHPNSTMRLTNFTEYSAKGNLTIEGASKDMDVEVSARRTENGYTLTGSFIVNTLDFPLRDKVKEKDINTDEIMVTFELVYIN